MAKLAIIAVHPDDETLGSGGTILKNKDMGNEVFWVIVTSMHLEDGYTTESINMREEQIKKISQFYRFDEVINLSLPTTRIDQYPRKVLIEEISKIFLKLNPDVVILPFKYDIHSDHRVIFDAAFSCTKIFRYPSIRKIYMMETLSETEFALSTSEESFKPNFFVNIDQYLNKKIEAMKVYSSELLIHPFPRSERGIKALATFRGIQAGCEFAEAFMLLKEIC